MRVSDGPLFEGQAARTLAEGRRALDNGSRCPLSKRSLDVAFALLVLLASAPIVAILALVIALDSPGLPFYRRRMAGLHGRPFWMYKLRTMRVDADAIIERDPVLMAEWKRLHKLKFDPRITRVGRVLRKYSLDELPQFWNVLAGEMSVVGPRPLSPDGAQSFGEAKAIIHSVQAGLTGLWQISGRQETSFEDRIRLDVWYVQHWSFWLDLKIIARTIGEVLRGRGAY
jgi:lipopolysaccharide/colanic/teichoic acid biosynthesis glycosyltransferase